MKIISLEPRAYSPLTSDYTTAQKERKPLRLEDKTGNRKVVNSYLSCDSRPDFQRVVVRAADYAVATELEAGDHMVVMTFQHL